MKITDADRLAFLEGLRPGAGLVNDRGRWALAESSWRNVRSGKGALVLYTCTVSARAWKPTVRAAIDAAIRREKRRADGLAVVTKTILHAAMRRGRTR